MHSRGKKIFLPITGQYENIGDVLHRRELLGLIKQGRTVHMFIGSAPQEFVDALAGEHLNLIFYRSLTKWLLRYFFSNGVLLFKSGQNTLGYKRWLFECTLFLLGRISFKGNNVLRIGVNVPRKFHKNVRIFKLFYNRGIVFWRTDIAKQVFSYGLVVPDLVMLRQRVQNAEFKTRSIVLSLRFDRISQPESFFRSLKEWSELNDYKIVILSQVSFDDEVSRKLADRYSWDLVLRNSDETMITFMDRLDELFKQSEYVFSDRLHVLLGAAVFNCKLLGLVSQGADRKIEDHFQIIDKSFVVSYGLLDSFQDSLISKAVAIRFPNAQQVRSNLVDIIN